MHKQATYRSHPSDRTKDNPLVEALQFHHDIDSLLSSATVTYSVYQDFWGLPIIYQQAELMGLHEMHIPLPHFKALYDKTSSLMLHRYRKRSPFSAESVRLKMRLAEMLNDKSSKFGSKEILSRTTAPSVIVVGASGTGKTTTIRHALNVHPQVIQHAEYKGRQYNQTQVIWLSFDMPATRSPKALALNFFAALDKATGTTNYFDEWSQKTTGYSYDMHFIAVQLLSQTYEIGLIHIDEVQFLTKYGKSSDSPSLATLEMLFNKLDIPVVLSTTYAGLSLFDSTGTRDGKITQEMTTCRRALSDTQYEIMPLKLEQKGFNQFFDALFPQNLLLRCAAVSDEFRAKFHFLSCGLVAIMARLAQQYHETLVLLVDKEGELNHQTDNVILLERVYKAQFNLIHPALQLLRVGDLNGFDNNLEKGANGKPLFDNSEVLAARKQKTTVLKDQIVKGGMFDEALKLKTLNIDDSDTHKSRPGRRANGQ